jgi:hypothetical protein
MTSEYKAPKLRTISGKVEVDRSIAEDRTRLLALIGEAVSAKIPHGYEFTYKFMDFGIQTSITETVELMFSVDVQLVEKQ